MTNKIVDWVVNHALEIAMLFLAVGGVAGAIAISVKVGSLGCSGSFWEI